MENTAKAPLNRGQKLWAWMKAAAKTALKAAYYTTVYLAAMSFFAFSFYRLYQETETYKNNVVQSWISQQVAAQQAQVAAQRQAQLQAQQQQNATKQQGENQGK